MRKFIRQKAAEAKKVCDASQRTAAAKRMRVRWPLAFAIQVLPFYALVRVHQTEIQNNNWQIAFAPVRIGIPYISNSTNQ